MDFCLFFVLVCTSLDSSFCRHDHSLLDRDFMDTFIEIPSRTLKGLHCSCVERQCNSSTFLVHVCVVGCYLSRVLYCCNCNLVDSSGKSCTNSCLSSVVLVMSGPHATREFLAFWSSGLNELVIFSSPVIKLRYSGLPGARKFVYYF